MKLSGADFRHRRRWTFASCAFDEAGWSLIVKGRRVSVETKPLELLRELLLNAGDVVSKDELLDAVWPNVTVVEASLPTAVRKLRLALGNDRIIETDLIAFLRPEEKFPDLTTMTAQVMQDADDARRVLRV